MDHIARKPEWLKAHLPGGTAYRKIQAALNRTGLHTICREARCPNLAECFGKGTAAFLILGNICTRNCLYCNVSCGIPGKPDSDEPLKLAETVRNVGLNYVVITSVTRDDLPDGGASFFAQCIGTIRKELPDCGVEVLIPDFKGDDDALKRVLESRPDVLNHNMEVVPAFFKKLRPGGSYQTSLKILGNIRSFNEAETGRAPIISKSGFMLGFGESEEDISILLCDLASAGCRSITIGQYQQPTRSHWPVAKYYRPEEFEAIKARAYEMGFSHVESGPLVRSSYHAASTRFKNHI